MKQMQDKSVVLFQMYIQDKFREGGVFLIYSQI